MSIDTCRRCGDFVDTDLVDTVYEDVHGNPRDHYLCGECEERLNNQPGASASIVNGE